MVQDRKARQEELTFETRIVWPDIPEETKRAFAPTYEAIEDYLMRTWTGAQSDRSVDIKPRCNCRGMVHNCNTIT